MVKPGGCIGNVNYLGSGDYVRIPRVEWGCGMGHKTIRGGLMPGGRLRMEKLASLMETGRLDTSRLLTHRFQGFAAYGRGAAADEGCSRSHQAGCHSLNLFRGASKLRLRRPFSLIHPSEQAPTVVCGWCISVSSYPFPLLPSGPARKMKSFNAHVRHLPGAEDLVNVHPILAGSSSPQARNRGGRRPPVSQTGSPPPYGPCSILSPRNFVH